MADQHSSSYENAFHARTGGERGSSEPTKPLGAMGEEEEESCTAVIRQTRKMGQLFSGMGISPISPMSLELL